MRASAVLLIALSVVGCEAAPSLPEDNIPPIARLVWPQLWPVDVPSEFDARQSEDPDGSALTYEMSFGDGTEVLRRPDGVFEHLFLSPGTFDVRLTVKDEHGSPASLEATITVARDTDSPICDCDVPCFEPAVCASSACWLTGTSDESEDAWAPSVENPLDCR